MKTKSLFIAALAIIAILAGSCSPAPTPVVPLIPQTGKETASVYVLAARDAALAYVAATAPRSGLTTLTDWDQLRVTPVGVVGVETFQFTSGDWMVLISYPLVDPALTVYEFSVTNPVIAFNWQGKLDANFEVIEASNLSRFPVSDAEQAREAALHYVEVTYGLAGLSARNDWNQQDITPSEMLGRSTWMYTTGSWQVVVNYPIVAPEYVIYQVHIQNMTSSFDWLGKVDPTGLVQTFPLPTATLLPTYTPQPIPPTSTPAPIPTRIVYCDWAKFVEDVTYPDGADVNVGATFTKVWRIKNIGTCTWTTDYALVFFSGDLMNGPVLKTLPQTVAPGQSIDISVNLTAPSDVGLHAGYWMLRNAGGVLFGIGDSAQKPFWVKVDVLLPTPSMTAVGWNGYVVGFNPGSQWDDMLVLSNNAGTMGVAGATSALEATLVSLRNRDDASKYAHFWGRLYCDMPDFGGCQLLVTSIRTGQQVTDADPVEGWEGTLVANPQGVQFDDTFLLTGKFLITYGIDSLLPDVQQQLVSLRDTGTHFKVWGILRTGVPDVSGAQIDVTRIEVLP